MSEDTTTTHDQMTEPEPLEGSATGVSTPETPPAQASSETGSAEVEKTKTSPAPGHALKGAWKQVENIGQTLGEVVQGRGNVVMVRVNDDTLEHLDMLVEAELARSRSEAAAMLITEGMKANKQTFDRIREITDQIALLRSHLRESVQGAAEESRQTEEGES